MSDDFKTKIGKVIPLSGLKTLLGFVLYEGSDYLAPVKPDVAFALKLIGAALAALGLIDKSAKEKIIIEKVKTLEASK